MKRRMGALLLVCCIIGTVLYPIQSNAKGKEDISQTIIEVSDYGVTPGGGEDCAEGIQEAVAAAKELSDDGKSVVINFPTGRYDIYPDKSAERELYISNTVGADSNYKNKKIGILLEEMNNVTVEGNDSLFMFHGKMTTLAAIDCENVNFQNFQIDFQVPTVVDITVESIEENTAIIYVPECYNYQINGTSIRWSGDKSPYTGETYWTGSNGFNYTQIYDTVTGLTWRGWNPVFSGVSSIEDLGNNRLKFTYGNISSELITGRCYQMRPTVRDHAGMLFWKSSGVNLEGLDIHFLHGFGIVGQFSENLKLNNVDFEAPKESGRTTSGYADFIQMSGCKGKIEISNCTFSNPHDDPINIHGTFLQVVEKIASNKIKVQYKHNETAGFPNFFVGDEIEYMTKGNMIPVEDSIATVTAVDGPDGMGGNMGEGSGSLTEIILTLDRDIPDEVGINSHVVENITYTPEVSIHDNVFKETPTRGILVTTRKKVVIEDNLFDGMGMAGIYISNDAQGWYESGPARDVTIRNNVFTRGKAQAIYVEPTNPTVSTTQTVHSNMTIQGNTFFMENQKVLDAKSVKDLTFQNNKIYRQDPNVEIMASSDQTELQVGGSAQLMVNGTGAQVSQKIYNFNGCQNVRIEDNLYDGGINASSSISNMSGSDVTVKGDNVTVGSGNNITDAVGKLYYVSSNENILKVSSSGVVTAVGEGTASIQTYSVSGGRRFEGNAVEFLVEGSIGGVMPTGVEITSDTERTDINTSVQYTAQVIGEAGVHETVTWSVLDAKTGKESDIAAISETGLLTPAKGGIAEICARTVNGLEARKLLVISEPRIELADNFEVINENKDHWSIPESGKVEIRAQMGGLWATQTPNNVIAGACGTTLENVTATIKVDGKTKSHWDESGLMFYKDNDNYVAIERKHAGGNPGIHVVTESGGTANEDGKKADIDSEIIYYKLVKTGNDITGYFSQDGNDWTEVRTVTNGNLGTDFRIGMIVGTGGANTDTPFGFSDLKVDGVEMPLTKESKVPTVKDAAVGYAEADNVLSVKYELSSSQAEAVVKWAMADEKNGIYSVLEGMDGTKVTALKAMKDKYVKAAVIPVTASGAAGEIFWTDPVHITGAGAESGAGNVKSSDALLKTAEITGLAKGFTFASDQYYYQTTASVDERVVNLKFEASDEHAILETKVNGQILKENAGEAALTSGRNLIEVSVTAEDQITSHHYRFTISRTGDNNAQLAGLSVDDEQVAVESGTYDYVCRVDKAGEAVIKAETASETAKAQIYVHGVLKSDGKAALVPGSNVVKILVTPETSAAPVIYTLNIKVPKADNANLERMAFSENIHISEKFDKDVLSYTGTATEELAYLTAEAEEKDAKIEISVNGKQKAAGTGAVLAEMRLQEGENAIQIKVVSSDGSQSKEYTAVLTGSGQAYLSDLEWKSASSGDNENPTTKDKSCGQNAMTLWNGSEEQVFAKGIGSHARSEIVYDISGQGYTGFEAYAGVDRETRGKPSEPNMIFKVYADTKEVFNSGTMYFDTVMKHTGIIDLTGVSELKLVMEGDSNTWSAHGDWADAKLLKSFQGTRFTVTGTAGDGAMGSVLMDEEDGVYCENQTATLTAEPKEGYAFVKWTDAEGADVSTQNPYQFKVTEDVSIKAVFEKIPEPAYTVSVQANDAAMGSVSIEPEKDSYTSGEQVTVTAVPKEGYQFTGWKEKGKEEILSTDAQYKFTVKKTIVLVADFKKAETPVIPTAQDVLDELIDSKSMPEKIEIGTEKLVLPKVPEGFTIQITKVNPEGIIGLDGSVIVPEEDTEVVVTVKVANGEESEATAEFKIVVHGEQKEEPPKMKFVDVNVTDWFYDYVAYVFEKGIMTGLDPEHFGPAEDLSRAQFATILYRMEGSPDVEYTAAFPDVADGMFYTKAALWANKEKIITGYEDKNFGPGDDITREQMAVMMYRYATYKGQDTSAASSLDAFPDGGKVSKFAEKAMKWAVAEKIINGNEDKTLAPQGTTSRAVCATIIQRYQDDLNEK